MLAQAGRKYEKAGDFNCAARNGLFGSYEPSTKKEAVRPDRQQAIRRDGVHLHGSRVRDLELQCLCLRQHRIGELCRFRRTSKLGKLFRAWRYAIAALARWPDRRGQLQC